MSDLFRDALGSPWLWALMALVPPAILALYFLKLKREPLEVPSTYLWNKSIEDLHVNSLWQKLRKSLLLLLQLLIIGLVILALWQPGGKGTELEGTKFVFLIDNSASMRAMDAGGKSRLDAAKEQLRALIDTMTSDMSAMIISFSDKARVVHEYSSSKSDLKAAVESIEPTSHTTNIIDALELADGLANPAQVIDEESGTASDVPLDPDASDDGSGDKTMLYIFSDGRFANVKDFSLGNLEPRYIPKGETDSGNLAITAFSTRKNETRSERTDAFVQVSNFSEEEQKVTVELLLDGQFADGKEITLPAGESRGTTFTLTAETGGQLTARLAKDSLTAAGDMLDVDNMAYAALNESAAGRVLLVTPGNKVLETALATKRLKRYGLIEVASPDILSTEDHQLLADTGVYDLIIYDQCEPQPVGDSPARMPRSNTLFVGRLPPLVSWWEANRAADEKADEADQPADADADAPTEEDAPKVERPDMPVVARPQIIDWERAHPLLAHVEIGNVYIEGSRVIEPPPGGRVLIDSTQGPIFAIASREGFEDAVLGFEILNSADGGQRINTNWYNRHSFPTFVYNLIDYFVSQDRQGVVQTNLPGGVVEIRSRALAPKLQILGPNDLKKQVTRTDEGTYLFYQTEVPGNYTLMDGENVVGRFAVNLFDGQESDIRVAVKPDDNPDDDVVEVASLEIGHTEVAQSESASTPTRKNYWRTVLVLALVLLLFEWYIYNRRVYL